MYTREERQADPHKLWCWRQLIIERAVALIIILTLAYCSFGCAKPRQPEAMTKEQFAAMMDQSCEWYLSRGLNYKKLGCENYIARNPQYQYLSPIESKE